MHTLLAAPALAAGSSGGSAGGLLPLLLIAVFGVLVVRGQRRRARALAATQAALAPGTEVMLTSGILGTVVEVVDSVVTLEVADGVQLRVMRGAVAELRTPVAEPDTAPAEEPADRV